MIAPLFEREISLEQNRMLPLYDSIDQVTVLVLSRAEEGVQAT